MDELVIHSKNNENNNNTKLMKNTYIPIFNDDDSHGKKKELLN